MKNYLSMLLAGIALLLLSCNNSANTNEESLAPQNLASEDTSSEEVVTDDEIITVVNDSNMNVAPAAETNASGQASSIAINPPHGQPGHRCEIAVGAPLSSAPTAIPASGGTILPTAEQGSTTQPIQIQENPANAAPPPNEPRSIMTTPATTSGAASTAPGMNPPHGQPGHDCSVPVGAPLKK